MLPFVQSALSPYGRMLPKVPPMTHNPVFNTEGEFEETPAFFFCDHATNFVPSHFDNLGLDHRYLETHIAFDIGALELSRTLSRRYGARLAWCGFSRLIIDPNRSKDRSDLIPEISDGIEVIGNSELSEADREARTRDFFEPYHHALAGEIGMSLARFDDPLIVSLHSFTPALHTDHKPRAWEVGVLWSHDEPTARAFMANLAKSSEVIIGDNEPYDARGFNYSVDRHVKPHKARHLTLEVRQDLIGDAAGVARMADLLERPIGDLI